MKYKYRMKRWIKVAIIIIILICTIIGIKNIHRTTKQDKVVQIHKKQIKPVREEINYELEQIEEIQEEPIVEEPNNTYTTRMTSFWANDGYGTGECTGSGLCSWNFGINENGWYTYDGKLVIATATTYLANQGWYVAEGVHLYKYGDEVTLTIDGVEYDAIVKDSCGNCMKTDRVDLFVSNGESARDTMVEVKIK